MEPQKVIISDNLQQSLSEAIAACQYDQLFVLVDTTTERLCLPVVADYDCMRDARRIVIPDTDTHKTLDSVTHVWSELQRLAFSTSTSPPRCSPWSMPPWAVRPASTSGD